MKRLALWAAVLVVVLASCGEGPANTGGGDADSGGHGSMGDGSAAHGGDGAATADAHGGRADLHGAGEEAHAEGMNMHGEADAGDPHGTGMAQAHIHGVQPWMGTSEIVLGTHEGVFRTQAGTSALVPLGSKADFMGFIRSPHDANTYWASGHFAAGGFGNWGFVESTDGGVTWKEISLSGTADFHELIASPDEAGLVVGLFSKKLYVSRDSGRTWNTYPYDGAVTALQVEAPAGPTLLIASASGILRLEVPSMTTQVVVSADVSALDRFPGGWSYASGATLHFCDSALTTCQSQAGPSAQKVFQVLAIDLQTLYVLTADSFVHGSADGGKTWAVVVSKDE